MQLLFDKVLLGADSYRELIESTMNLYDRSKYDIQYSTVFMLWQLFC